MHRIARWMGIGITFTVAMSVLGTEARSQQPAPASTPIVRIGAKLNAPNKKLRGIVDMHTHPMAHLGFGGKVVHGAPDVDVLMLKGTIVEGSGCNAATRRARTREEALGSCLATHGGWDAFKNTCGDLLRHELVKELEKGKHSDHAPDGFAAGRWPRYDDVTHQQMWVDWVKRAYDGGLRVMVALAVNSYTLAGAMKAGTPQDDKAVADLQISEMKRMVSRHPWMEVATSSRQLRQIVAQDKLAIVLGVELDDIGNFNMQLRSRPDGLTDQVIAAEIRRLHALGVRYMFPVHLIDNAFGGTATYIDLFNVANRNHFGRWWDLECAPAGSGVTWRHKPPRDFLPSVLGLTTFGIPPTESVPLPSCPAGIGYQNRRGLLRRGKVALQQMMRLGTIIDIDHGSRRMTDAVLAYTNASGGYPVVSGHNGLPEARPKVLSEHTRTRQDYVTIGARGGMAGVGWGDRTAAGFVRGVGEVLNVVRRPTGLGTDINGLEPTPGGPCDPVWAGRMGLPTCKATGPLSAKDIRPPIDYSDSAFPAAQMGAKKWDYNTQGVAHYGLLPDFLRHAEQVQRSVVDTLFDGAEAFATTWERAESIAAKIPETVVPKTALGEDCDASQECQSGRCDPKASRCIPNDGTGNANDYCTHGNQCRSRRCTIACAGCSYARCQN